MTYEELIVTVSFLVESDKVLKTGLTLVYELTEKNHKQMNEQLFYKSNPPSVVFIPSDEFEVELGGILVKFVKPKLVTAD
jgi:hypothetical protein